MSPTELYSYTEEPEFALNRDYFEEDFRSHGTVLSAQTCVRDLLRSVAPNRDAAPLLFIRRPRQLLTVRTGCWFV